MKNDFIGRYIYAVTRHLPQKMRDETEKELDSLIGDMLDARCGDRAPEEKDIKIVLMELGSPEEMAAQYSGDERQALISGRYYLMYKKILALVLPIVAGAVFLANAVSSIVKPDFGNLYAFIAGMIARSFGGALAGAVEAFTVITVVFAILERKQVDFGREDFLSELPQVPENASRIKLSDPISDIVWAVLSGAVLLLCPQIICARFEGTGWIPVFNTEVIASLWYLVVFWVVCEIVREIFTVIEGCHSKRLAIVKAVTNTLIAVSLCLFFGNGKLINPVFLESAAGWYTGENAETLMKFLQNLNLVIIGIAFIVLTANAAQTAFKAWRFER